MVLKLVVESSLEANFEEEEARRLSTSESGNLESAGFWSGGMRPVYFTGAVKVGEALFGGDEIFGGDRGEDSLFGHDEAITFVEEIVAANFGGSEIDGDEVCAGAKAAAVAAFGLSEV